MEGMSVSRPERCGLFDSDDELAWVVAHEIAHNVLNHSQNARLRAMLNAFLGAHCGRLCGGAASSCHDVPSKRRRIMLEPTSWLEPAMMCGPSSNSGAEWSAFGQERRYP